jgi:hypothetical protein
MARGAAEFSGADEAWLADAAADGRREREADPGRGPCGRAVASSHVDARLVRAIKTKGKIVCE